MRCIMQRFLSSQIGGHVGELICLAGWLHRVRQLSQVSFLILLDRAGLAQIVIADAALAGQRQALHPETVIYW